MTVVRTTVCSTAYILCGRRKEIAAVCVMIQQHRQYNNIAKTITQNPIQYDR
jgi:hypothetical protein